MSEAMSDKELLEAAAKAAGIQLTGEDYARRAIGLGHFENFPWNPLTNDGDALRLAAKLRLHVEFTNCFVVASRGQKWSTQTYGDGNRAASEQPTEEEVIAATRRAIVRAAAHLSKEQDK